MQDKTQVAMVRLPDRVMLAVANADGKARTLDLRVDLAALKLEPERVCQTFIQVRDSGSDPKLPPATLAFFEGKLTVPAVQANGVRFHGWRPVEPRSPRINVHSTWPRKELTVRLLGLAIVCGCLLPACEESPLTRAAASSVAPPKTAHIPDENIVPQPVQEYFCSFEDDTRKVAGTNVDNNPFRFYTHLGTDYGRMGPAKRQIKWGYHEVSVSPLYDWAGMWHSLVGLARERETGLDFARCYPSFIRDGWQPRCVGLVARTKGRGRLKLELNSPDERLLWNESTELNTSDYETLEYAFTEGQLRGLRRVKRLNWVAEPGASFSIDSLALLIRYPNIPFDKRLFLVSYAKLARCFSERDGVVRDRAHVPAGDFDCVPTSGLFCLATALASKLGVVDPEFASAALENVHRAISALPRARGLLPHFIRKYDGRYRVHENTEYSTMDSSLYYHGMLLAARILGNARAETELTREVQAIEFSELHTPEGFVVHGLKDDGRELLRSCWRDWGGETALVLLLERMAVKEAAKLRMGDSGKVPQGVGFILEIQNLFYREFDSEILDAVSHRNWHAARRDLLARQVAYFSSKPGSKAGRAGVFGLSAGEGPRGVGYVANGVDVPGLTLIHPHYMLMSGTAQKDPKELYRVFKAMEQRGLLPPWGMVENVNEELSEYLPFLGSLNASFECISAYHLWAKVNNQPDAVYDAADSCDTLSQAIRAFYPTTQRENRAGHD